MYTAEVYEQKEEKRRVDMDKVYREALLRGIEAITEKQVDTVNGAHLWRFAVEHEIVAMRQDFENRYAYVLGQETDLMLKLAKRMVKNSITLQH